MLAFALCLALQENWKDLFDSKSLGSWKEVDFGGQGKTEAKDGAIEMGEGVALTGVVWKGEAFPKTGYELSLEAMKIDGSDFFCGVAFPVGDKACSFVAGGWGGGVVGLSSLDGMNASENDTSSVHSFKKGQWYKFRIRVEAEKIQAWIDDKQVVDAAIKGKEVSIHPAMEAALPLGIANYTTPCRVRAIRIRPLK
jgi:hypothetical protein